MTDLQRFKRTKLYRKERREESKWNDIIMYFFPSTSDNISKWVYFSKFGDRILDTHIDWNNTFAKNPYRTILIELK